MRHMVDLGVALGLGRRTPGSYKRSAPTTTSGSSVSPQPSSHCSIRQVAPWCTAVEGAGHRRAQPCCVLSYRSPDPEPFPTIAFALCLRPAPLCLSAKREPFLHQGHNTQRTPATCLNAGQVVIKTPMGGPTPGPSPPRSLASPASAPPALTPFAERFRWQLATVSLSPSVQMTAEAPIRARITPTTPAPQPSSRQRRPACTFT